MPTTRSVRALSSFLSNPAVTSPKLPKHSKTKRKAQDTDDAPASVPETSKKQRVLVPSSLDTQAILGENQILPAVLTFSFETAKQHLISVDARFKGVFSKLPCQPFEQLERVDPFRTLTTSILGQQISWMAARSIRHRFIRLYDTSLPEKPPAFDPNAPKIPPEFFPTASQVANTDVATLKSAGLSTRKAEYIKDLAARFADGRLTNKKLVEADDEELAKVLIEVRGIGRWTVDMFAMFSLRRPDILPVGDLGVQRGLIRWFLSLHSQSDPITITKAKLPKPPSAQSKSEDVLPNVTFAIQQSEIPDVQTEFPSTVSPSSTAGAAGKDYSLDPVTPIKEKGMAIMPSPGMETIGLEAGREAGSIPILPKPFTPSINKILNPHSELKSDAVGDKGESEQKLPPSLPEGLTVTVLKSRLNGKKKIKGALLTPQEMEVLTEPWRPYRSLGVYYMWALAEEAPTK